MNMRISSRNNMGLKLQSLGLDMIMGALNFGE
jgi:hypothetical protein